MIMQFVWDTQYGFRIRVRFTSVGHRRAVSTHTTARFKHTINLTYFTNLAARQHEHKIEP